MSTNEAERENESNETPNTAAETTPETSTDATSAPSTSEAAAEPAVASESAGSSESAESTEADGTSTIAEPAAPETPVVAAETAAAPATTTSATKPATKSPEPKAEGPSAGQRIAAQRAAKAAKKAVDKARRAEDAASAQEADDEAAIASSRPVQAGPDEVEIRAAEVSKYVESHSGTLVRVVGAVAAAAVIAFGVSFYLGKKDESAGWALSHAIAATSAEIGAAPESPDGRLRFGTEAQRDAEALRRFRKVVSEYGSSDAARYAHLAIAGYLIDDEKYVEAQAELRKARTGLEDDVQLDAAILEANGLALLGQDKYAEAQAEFERLGRVDRPRHTNTADYLLARTAYERGDRNGAKTKLLAIRARFEGPDATPEPHIQLQVDELLRILDPASLPERPQGGGFDFSSLPPEIRQQLLQQGLGGLGQ